jgi:hypothetical protein
VDKTARRKRIGNPTPEGTRVVRMDDRPQGVTGRLRPILPSWSDSRRHGAGSQERRPARRAAEPGGRTPWIACPHGPAIGRPPAGAKSTRTPHPGAAAAPETGRSGARPRNGSRLRAACTNVFHTFSAPSAEHGGGGPAERPHRLPPSTPSLLVALRWHGSRTDCRYTRRANSRRSSKDRSGDVAGPCAAP